MKVDVLTVLSGARDCLRTGPRGHVSIGGQLEVAQANIAELIAADEEYDSAKAEFAKYEHDDDDDDLYLSALRRLQWATDRRATAILACKGQDHER